MIKILVVTARIPEKLIREIVSSYTSDKKDLVVDIVSSRKPVAAMMTIRDLEDVLRDLGEEVKKYDFVITPGLLIGDVSIVCSKYGVRCFKGSRFAGDLPRVLDYVLKGLELSTKEPADKIVESFFDPSLHQSIYRDFSRAFRIGDLDIPTKSPPILLAAEAVLRKDLSRDLREIQRISRYSDIIVLGTEADSNDPDYVKKITREISRELFSRAIAIDSLNIKEIKAAVEEGASLVMNLSKTFDYWVDELREYLEEIGFVVVPDYVGEGSAAERAEYSLREYEYFKSRGVRKIILDPVAPPPLFGSLEGIYATTLIKKRAEEIPVILGAANIYELIDADPMGSIAILTSFALETGASIILATEESWKTRGSVEYFRRSIEMIHRAYTRKSPPIDVGVDLLVAKSKKKSDYIEISFEKDVVIDEYLPPKRIDQETFFVVQVDHENNMIEVYIFSGSKEKALYRLRGRDPRSLGRKALELSGVSDPEHALYLGVELARAYEALRTGRSYVQDLFEEKL